MPEVKDAPKKDAPAAAGDAPRPIHAIQADLDRCMAKFRELEAVNRDHTTKRTRMLLYRKKMEAQHAAKDTGMPFDPNDYQPPAHVPPEDSPVQAEFHALHYTIDKLKNEMTAANAAAAAALG